MKLNRTWCKSIEKHRYRSRQIFGGAKDFCPNFPKLVRKNVSPLFVHCMNTVFQMTFKKTSSCHFGRHCLKSKQNGAQIKAPFLHFQGVCRDFQKVCEGFHRFCPDFHGFSDVLPGFLPNQNVWGCACTPCTPASHTTVERCLSELLASISAPTAICKYLGRIYRCYSWKWSQQE